MDTMRENVVYITYEEAQKLKPFFEYSKANAPYKEAKESAKRILRELGYAKPMDYSPFRGYQMLLNNQDYDFFMDALAFMQGIEEG